MPSFGATGTYGCAVGVGGAVGWVEGEPVREADLDAYLAWLGASPAGARLGAGEGPAPARGSATERGEVAARFTKEAALRTWGAKSLLADRLLEREAARFGVRDLTSVDEWVAALEAAGEIARATPSEADALACYRASLGRYRAGEARRARHVLVGDPDLARELAAEARRRGAASLAELAGQWSADAGSRQFGGDLGWVERGQLAGALEEAIFCASPGEVCGPVESAFGWHVLVVEAVRPPALRSFDECRAEISEELALDRRRSAFRQWWAKRLAEAVVVPAGAEHPCDPGLPGSVHRH